MAEFNADKAKFIQNLDGIKISESHFISEEGAKLYDYPSFWYDHGKGAHVLVVRLDNIYYLTQPTGTGKPYKGPIPYSVSSLK